MSSSPRPTRVSQLRLVVEAEDFDAALAFYRDALGLTEQAAFEGDDDARVVILEAGRATLELANPAQKRMIDAVEVGRPVSPRIRVAFEVGDTAAVTAALVEGGATLIAPPTETPWRSLNSRLEAPAGLQITLFEELEPLDARRAMPGFGTQSPDSTAMAGDGSESGARRLGPADRRVARTTFELMAEVFDETTAALSDAYIDGLLARSDFWVIAAMIEGRVVGGLSAHTLPMTVFEGAEIFLYDIAVSEEFQRRGVGSGLVDELLRGARAAGIDTVFVLADDEDVHALDFYRSMNAAPSAVTIFEFTP